MHNDKAVVKERQAQESKSDGDMGKFAEPSASLGDNGCIQG